MYAVCTCVNIFQDPVLLLHNGWLSLTLDSYQEASSSFCLCVREESLFSRGCWNLSIQQTNLCPPLLLSAPSTSGWARQLPRVLHCKQPLCCHPPAPQTVGSLGRFYCLWRRTKQSLELVKQPLIRLLHKLQSSPSDDMFMHNPSLWYPALKYGCRDMWRFFAYASDTLASAQTRRQPSASVLMPSVTRREESLPRSDTRWDG